MPSSFTIGELAPSGGLMGEVQSSGKLVTFKNGRTRLFRSKLVRRQIIEETMKPEASVALVARAPDVNANQIFNWRKMYEKVDWIPPRRHSFW